jgi:hypothetical protein
MAEKKSLLSKLFSRGHSHSQGPQETSSTKPTKKNVLSIRSRSPHPEPARDKGKAVQIDPNRAKDEPSMDPKAPKSNEERPPLAEDDADRSAEREGPVALLPETVERGTPFLKLTDQRIGRGGRGIARKSLGRIKVTYRESRRLSGRRKVEKDHRTFASSYRRF